MDDHIKISREVLSKWILELEAAGKLKPRETENLIFNTETQDQRDIRVPCNQRRRPSLITVWECQESGCGMLRIVSSDVDIRACPDCGGKVRAKHVKVSPVRGAGANKEADLGLMLLLEAQK